jgi:hypothetical protein
MYYAGILLLTLVLPLGSAYAEHGLDNLPWMLLVGKWFAVWAGGVRLFMAGLRQQIRPRLTSEGIFGITSDDPLPFVRELGQANCSMGVLGIAAAFVPVFVLPAAIVTGLYYLQAGIGHIRHGGRNLVRNVAMVSDLYVAAALLGYVGWAIASYL